VLVPPPAVGEVAARDHELRRGALDETGEGALENRIVTRTEMKVGDMQDARNHRRSRLYSECNGRRAVD
jgi:precorrin-4 methylase